VLVVGGTSGEIGVYRERARSAGVENRLHFVGMQPDVRPFLWLSDVFLFPTIYEAASKAVLQAAAAGLPLLTTRVHGAEDVVVHGDNGWFVERTAESVAAAIERALRDRRELAAMGGRARLAVAPWDRSLYVQRWDALLRELVGGPA
jgi:glycosyltransferase involved in cell wall biosynthesis